MNDTTTIGRPGPSGSDFDGSLGVIDAYESNVRAYCRDFPTLFVSGTGATLRDQRGRAYVDFFAGAGALNYGHNPPAMKQRLIEYLRDDGVTHGLDMATGAKARFLAAFHEVILEPRGMDYRIAFPGPTGTNAVECALKIARKATGRQPIVAFTNAFHGMTLGSLALTGNRGKRTGAGVSLTGAIRMPFDGYLGPDVDTLDLLERVLEDKGSGVDHPAAAVVETIQAEGGIRVASDKWLRRLRSICDAHEMLLIVDDIQVGCGRTGPFFSFEPAGIRPDLVCLSKSLSGYGLPLAVTLADPRFDCLAPGEHNGTFRGNNLAFVTAVEALDYWRTDDLRRETEAKGHELRAALEGLVARYPDRRGRVVGRGMILGVALPDSGLAEQIATSAFERGLILETAGSRNEVLKVMPPLVATRGDLARGVQILSAAFDANSNRTSLAA